MCIRVHNKVFCTCVAALAPAAAPLRTLELRHCCPESAELGETLGELLHLTSFSLTTHTHECFGGLSRLPLGLRSLRVEVDTLEPEDPNWDVCDAACDRVAQLRALEFLTLWCWVVPSDNPEDHPALRELDLRNNYYDVETFDVAYRAADVVVR